MKEFLGLLTTVGLFKGIAADELESTLKCLGSEIKPADKDEILLLAGDKPQYVGIVLSGQLHIIREDHDGNSFLLAAVTSGEIFAEALCCSGISESPVTVMAETSSSVMLLSFSRILHTCPSSCLFHTKLIANMLQLIAQKNLQLQNRMEIVILKSVRAKVLRYLESFAYKQDQEFAIPLNREELANFLCVDRSALSHELARMKNDGLLEYRKNRFTLRKGEA